MSEDPAPVRSTTPEMVTKGVAALASAIPFAGGPLAAIANEIVATRQNRRLNQFLADLVQDVERLRDQLNQDFLRSDDAKDLIEHTFVAAAATRQQKKLDAIRAVFINTVTADSPSYDESAEILDLLQQWQARHVVLMRVLASPREVDEHAGHPVGQGGGITTSISAILSKLLPTWTPDQIERTWEALHKAGMHRTPGTKTMMSDQGIRQLEGRLTDFGRRVADFLTQPR